MNGGCEAVTAKFEAMSVSDIEQRLKDLNSEEKLLLHELEKRKKAQDVISKNGLTNREISKYSRQLILPEFGVNGQKRLKAGSAAVVGAGGLGCPSAFFLAAAGVGRLALIDYDDVDESNLHRQIGHTESRVGESKAESLKKAIKDLNSLVRVDTFKTSLDSSNALDILKDYDVVLDCTDNVATRYLLNDACVILKKPLVSGSALRFEGQLTVYNYQGGPTYRCLFPDPPPPESVTNCSDGGVLGVVPGIIGSLQALEALKILSEMGSVLSGKLLLFDGLSSAFRSIKLRPRKSDEECAIEKLIDYEQFCGAKATDKDTGVDLLKDERRITVNQLDEKLKMKSGKSLMIDVRTKPEIEICSLEEFENFPLNDLIKDETAKRIRDRIDSESLEEVVIVCRRGNDSQKAALLLAEILPPNIKVVDVKGGLHAWRKSIDSSFPIY